MSKTLLDFCTSNVTLENYVWNVISGLRFFTADDLHVLEAETERLGYDRRVFGAVLRSFEVQGKIAKVGYVCSGRKECHGRPILKWMVLDKPEVKMLKTVGAEK